MSVAASPSPLPSPPTSPVSSRPPATRIRIKPKRASLGSIPSTADLHGHSRTMSSLSRIVTDISPTSPSTTKSQRRQSSITYYTPTSPSPWSQRHRTLASNADSPQDEPGLVNGRENMSQRSSLVLTSRSSSTRESLSSVDGMTREREPLTLVEKHADLLHFIAQKERKCLELRDQLAAHEKELVELKHKWERIVNGGQDTSNPSSTSLGGVALDGLKEGVRMIAAGLSDFSGVIHELESTDDTKPIPTRAHRPSHLSTTPVAISIHEGGTGEEGTRTGTVSLSRASSLSRRHKRASCAEPSTHIAPPPPDTCTFARMPSPTMVSPPPPHTTGSTWMDTMGRKLGGLQKSPTLSKSQKRASSFLAGVSSTITFALSPGPTATTPAPRPLPRKSLNARATSQQQRQTQTLSEPHSNPNPAYGAMSDWLADDAAYDEGEGEHTATRGMVSPPSLLSSPPSESSLHLQPPAQIQRTPVAVSSFDDDTWNW